MCNIAIKAFNRIVKFSNDLQEYPPYMVTRTNFFRRTKPTIAPVTTDANTAPTDNIETTTNKYNSRGISKFKSRNDGAEKDVPKIEKTREEENVAEIQTRRPYLNSTAARNDQTTPRNFTRRRLGGAYTTSRSISPTTAAPVSRRPFRVASRRRPAATIKTSSTTTTTQSTTNILDSEEYLQDFGETDSIEDPSITSSSDSKNRKVQRRPLISLKVEQDQNPAATSEEEEKRQSKKYSSSFKQNQLDEVLRLKAQDDHTDIDQTTDGKFTVESYSAETAVALAAHKLLEAPVPVVHDYEYEEKSSKNTQRNNKKLNYTTDFKKEVTKTASYPISYSTTPNYSTATQDNNIQTSTSPVISSDLLETLLPSTGAFKASEPAGFTAPTITNPGLSGVSRILGPSTVRYLSTTDQNTATHNINPLDDRYTDNSEKYSKAPPSTIQYVSTVNEYSGVSYDSTPRDRYVDISQTSQTLSRTDSMRNRRPTTGRNFPDTETLQTLPPPTPSTNRYFDTNNGFTGIPQGPSVSHEYTSSSDKYTDGLQTAKPSTIDYLDSTRYTGTSQRLNPTNRFTVTSPPSTATYFEDSEFTRVSQDESSVNSFISTSATELPLDTGMSTMKNTDTDERYTTVQNLSPTYRTETSDKYKSISRKRKPSTTSTENENVTTETQQRTNPTNRYSSTNERYTEASRRRRPSTNAESEKYTTGSLQNASPTEAISTTTGSSVISRRRRPSTNSYTDQPTTEPSSTFGFTATSAYTNAPRRTRPLTTKYTDVTSDTPVISQYSGPTTGLPDISEKFTETSSTIKPSTDIHSETFEKTTETPFISTDTVIASKKYSEVSRRPSTSTFVESVEKHTELNEDDVSTDHYFTSNGQYTGIIQDHQSPTPKYFSTEERSQSVSPSSIKYPSTTDKYVSGPIDDFSYSTAGYSQSQDTSDFTREYLLASPVTKTYDDEYQYLSPVTSNQPSSTTRKLARKKTVFRRISTTASPSSTTTTTTQKPRRVVSRKPFEKIRKVQKVNVLKNEPVQEELQLVSEEQPVKEIKTAQRVQTVQRVQPVRKVETSEPNTVIKPIGSYDYYDDSEEKVIQKYEEETKVILHGKGNIECLDIGNFPHPSSCKKFISCARMESGALLGWEYVCPKGLSFDPVGSICNWSAGLGCNEQDS
ncbi:unnamed protein product [Parnassius mnemosyne]|uniref:Chitin-binding type-2 domain-containing protein n=1 Tax=Parnassius mnemosyne TaxID=213953 RepID=A0AAV1KCS7_9NEOP